jgi:hypothetical protein
LTGWLAAAHDHRVSLTESRRAWSSVAALVLAALACTEPNPYAQESGADANTGDGDGDGDGDGEPPGCGEPACSLGLARVSFSLQGNDSFSAQIPKPAEQASIPIAAVQRYEPGQSETLGYAIAWTDNGDSWGLEVTTSGAAANSRVAGVAAVIGLGADFPPPELHELEITTADGCGQLSTTALAGRVFVDTVERYEPGEAAVFEFARTASVGETATVEYCVTQPDSLDASLKIKLVAFDLPDGARSAAAAATLSSNASRNQSFTELGTVSELVHLTGAHGLNESSVPSLGYRIDCATQSPYACSYDLVGFKAGAKVEVGGVVLAIR